MHHAGVKSSIDSSRMFNERYAEIPSGALGTWGCPGSPGGRVHLSPSPSICLTDSFVSLCLPSFGQPGRLSRLSGVEGFICLPLSPFICLPLSPSLDAWHGSLGGRVHLSPFVSLHLSPVASQPGCLARLSGWTGSFVSLCLPSFVWHGSLGFVSLHLSPVVSQPGCLARLSRRTDSLVSLSLPSFVSRCPPAWMPGTALWVDSFTCLPLSPFIWLPLSPSICLPSLWVDGLICLPLSPFICLPLSPSLDASLGGRIHLSPFVSLCLSPVVSGTHAPRFPSLPAVLSFWRGLVCLRLRPWLRSFLVLWMLGTGSSVCPSSGLRFCLGSWWVVFLVYRWLHPVCSFSASLSVAASLCPCSHLESRADESGALRCTASATRRLC